MVYVMVSGHTIGSYMAFTLPSSVLVWMTLWALQSELCLQWTTLIDWIVYLDGIILDILQRTDTMLIPNLSLIHQANFSVSDRIRTYDPEIPRP